MYVGLIQQKLMDLSEEVDFSEVFWLAGEGK